MSKTDARSVARDLANGEFDNAVSKMSRYDTNSSEYMRTARKTLEDIHKRLTTEAGYEDLGHIENYFPRQLKDYKEFLKSINATDKSQIDRAFAAKAKSLGLKSADDLGSGDRIDIINQVMRGRKPIVVDAKPGFTGQRTVGKIDDRLIEQYQDPKTALNSYIMKSVNDLHKRKFVGRGSQVKDTGVQEMNLGNSIGGYLDDAVAKGEMAADDMGRMAELLEARFGLGEASANKINQAFRNIGYLTTLGNPFSALTQIGDIGMSAYINGFRHTIASMLGRKNVDISDLGLDKVIGQELATVGKTARLLDAINSSFRKFKGMSNNADGVESLRKKYGVMLGDEFKNTMSDLRAGNITENVKLMLFNELSGVQPISLSEMPLNYLRNPNGRIFYSLKTFAIKQLDVMRRDIVQEIKSGNKAEGVKNLVAYMTIIPMMGATVEEAKDMLRGQGGSVDDIPDNYIDNLFKVFGGSQYVMDKYVGKGQIGTAVGEIIAPPTDWINAIGEDVMSAASGEFVGSDSKMMRELPIIGKVWYNFFGGGLEKAMEFEQKQRLD